MYSNNVSILLGYGNGSFANQTTYSTGSQPSSAAVGDFNNDTRLDIVVVHWNSSDMSILLGYSNGSFASQKTYLTGSQPSSSVTVGDLNNDTRLDIVVANCWWQWYVNVLLGYGDGSFANQTTYLTGSGPWSVAVGDLNNDTRLDIVVANALSDNVFIFLGIRDVTFVNPTTVSTGNGSRPQSFVIGDFNNDDCMDIGVVNSGTHSIGIYLGYGNISFANPARHPTSPNSSPCSIAAGDFQ